MGISSSARKNDLKPRQKWAEEEIAFARRRWGSSFPLLEELLRSTLLRTRLSVRANHLQLMAGKLYVNHSGLLQLARLNRCVGIETEIVGSLSRPSERRWVVKATVFKSCASKHGFVGFGDADPGNVSSLVRGSELRVAETRAVNRALRKAYAVGLCSAEEIGSISDRDLAVAAPKEVAGAAADCSGTVVAMTVGDRLKLILREHQLDPVEVLHYAYRFIGVSDLKSAPTSELERFARHLEQLAIANRTWLQAELSQGAQSAEPELRGESNGEAA